MKNIVIAASAALAFSLMANPGFAEEKKPSAQQNKMKECNKSAGDKKLKGDERKSFMSTCLKGDGAAAAPKADSGCAAKAVSKEGKPLAGAAKSAFLKKCEADAKSAGAAK
jgi:hypothetical protein